MDGLLKFGLTCAGGSLVCFVLAGDGGLMAIWFGVAVVTAPLIVIKLKRDATAESAENAEAPRHRHHNYVFASETSTPKRRRKVVP